ncbi:MAG TPA: ATP-binding protein [Polyangiaceae bacterium]|nr:ATP-binding protein [Polyangiaceae bacterium]
MSDSPAEHVLIFALFGSDTAITQRVLQDAHIASKHCPDLDVLCRELEAGSGALILAEEALSPVTAERLLQVLDAQPTWSDLPVIISAAERAKLREGFGAAALLGTRANVTLLERPVSIRTILSSVRAALRARQRQYQTRALLEQLALSEARFRRVQEASPQGLMIFRPVRDTSGEIFDLEWLYTNPAAERVFERSHAQLLARRLLEEVPECRASGAFAAYVRAFEEGVDHECELKAGARSLRAFRSIAFRLDNDLALVIEDVTEQKRIESQRAELLVRAREARERAEATNRSKDEFLAMVSHELRTPLNAMLGWAKMLSLGKLGDEQSQRAIEAIERNALAQAQLVEDLLDISRIIAGKLRLEMRQTQLSSVIEAAVDAVKPALQAKGIRLHQALDPARAQVLGDPNRLQQVLWNLLSNAIKFTPPGGNVKLRLRGDATTIEITVSDDGQGIEPEFIPYLFQRFQQEDTSITRTQGGLGLGLAISRHLVELHGGTIEATSEGQGRGATFRCRFPISTRTEVTPYPARVVTPVPSPSTFDHPPELRGLRILVVDDEPDARDLLQALLSHCGAVPLTAASADEAYELLVEQKPDVILSDIGMPQQDGYEFMRRVRALPQDRGGRTPAAALTAYARAEDRRLALRAGFEMHVSKPVEPSELVAAVATLARIGHTLA